MMRQYATMMRQYATMMRHTCDNDAMRLYSYHHNVLLSITNPVMNGQKSPLKRISRGLNVAVSVLGRHRFYIPSWLLALLQPCTIRQFSLVYGTGLT
ncbi:MAG TPA: hypothetical protein PLL64_13160, partial [Rhodothermales bacterium]|nr:hypothetical protein [Rhodothermales bacterium]